MIPVKLDLYNFLAYHEPEPLDLTGLHLACLAGSNGAGKSSLLDAITWALWGKARTRRDDDLIHADEEEMKVQLTFALSGDRFRVTRYRSRKGRGTSLLDLEVADSGGWRSLSDATIRGTQQHINDLLKLDYETFINSAFLVQGRADEFTQKTPGERKAILGEILGLDRWATYEDRVKQRLKAVETDSTLLERDLERIDEEIGREAEFQNELTEAETTLDEINAQVEEAESFVRELEATRQNRLAQQDRYEDLDKQIARTRRDLNSLMQRRKKIEQRLTDYRELIAKRDEIEAGYERLQDARQTERTLSANLIEQSDLREQQSALQQEITAARSDLQATLRSLE